MSKRVVNQEQADAIAGDTSEITYLTETRPQFTCRIHPTKRGRLSADHVTLRPLFTPLSRDSVMLKFGTNRFRKGDPELLVFLSLGKHLLGTNAMHGCQIQLPAHSATPFMGFRFDRYNG